MVIFKCQFSISIALVIPSPVVYDQDAGASIKQRPSYLKKMVTHFSHPGVREEIHNEK
jgi:hypothetical protein